MKEKIMTILLLICIFLAGFTCGTIKDNSNYISCVSSYGDCVDLYGTCIDDYGSCVSDLHNYSIAINQCDEIIEHYMNEPNIYKNLTWQCLGQLQECRGY